MEWIKIFESVSIAEGVLKENHPRLLLVQGKRVCVVMRNGKILAVQNSCAHSGGSLHLGAINFRGEIVCPQHQYQFNLITGRENGQRSADLECYPIREDEDGIFIGI